jgi:hypothetical protein
MFREFDFGVMDLNLLGSCSSGLAHPLLTGNEELSGLYQQAAILLANAVSAILLTNAVWEIIFAVYQDKRVKHWFVYVASESDSSVVLFIFTDTFIIPATA